MSTENWVNVSFSLTRLAELAKNSGRNSAFEFLKDMGVVPEDVKSVSPVNVKTSFNPREVPAGYLASAAYEWDSWGPSDPTDFIEVMQDELNPEKREYIANLLTALGRTVN